MKTKLVVKIVAYLLVLLVYQCAVAQCNLPRNPVLPYAKYQGAVIGEVRAFSFGADKTKTWIWNGSNLVNVTLQELGWISAEGQSLDDGEFPELACILKSPPPPNSTSSIWGSLDLSHDFSLPDLRGMFLRGFQPSDPAPPNPAGEALDRQQPRPDITASGSSQGQTDPRAVGSFQFQQLQNHRHSTGSFSYAQDHSGGAIGGWENTPGKTGYTEGVVDANSGVETRPKNVHVMYCIWTGHNVTNAHITPADVTSERFRSQGTQQPGTQPKK